MPGLYPVYETANASNYLPESWNDEKQQISGRKEEAKILNSRLDKISARVMEFTRYLPL